MTASAAIQNIPAPVASAKQSTVKTGFNDDSSTPENAVESSFERALDQADSPPREQRSDQAQVAGSGNDLPPGQNTAEEETDAGRRSDAPSPSATYRDGADTVSETGETLFAEPLAALAPGMDKVTGLPGRAATTSEAGQLSGMTNNRATGDAALPNTTALKQTSEQQPGGVPTGVATLAGAAAREAPAGLPADKKATGELNVPSSQDRTTPAAALSLNREATRLPQAGQALMNAQPDAAVDALALPGLDKMLSSQKLAMDTLAAGLDKLASAGSATTDPRNAAMLPLSTSLNNLNSPTPTVGAVYQGVISETPGQGDWNQGMGRQVMWMASQNIRSAELRLNPANLGTIEVRIDMEDDQVNVAFSSRHVMVRDAIEQALPRLREMMEEQGLNLNDTDISGQAFAEQQENAFAREQTLSVAASTAEETLNETADILPGMSVVAENNTGNTLVDYYI